MLNKPAAAPSTGAPKLKDADAVARPETFRIPKPGESDKWFGFSRSWYYSAEARGWLRLIRIRAPGRERGVTVVPYRAVEALVRAQIEAQNGG